MSATIHRFRSRRDRLEESQADVVRQGLLDLGEAHDIPWEALGRVVAALDQVTVSGKKWTFVMLSPQQNAAVVQWLRQNSKRPLAAVAVWAEMFTAMRMDTGEIMLARAELAERVGILPRHLSSIVSEMVSIGAIARRRDGRGVRYFMNPTVATHLTGKAREAAQDAAPQLSLV